MGALMSAAIEFSAVSYRTREGTAVLRDLDLAIAPGETLAILGRSGSGKTTALKLINRLLDPTAGEVRVDGKPTTAWDTIRLRRRIGWAIQEVGLFPHRTVAENIATVPQLEHWDKGRLRARVGELLEMVDMPADRFASRYPHQLSGGQRQRVGLARALAADPPILLMDEPFGALDPLTRAGLQQQFQSLQARLRKTVVFVTHDVREALRLGSRIAMLDGGRLIAVNTAEEFLVSPDPVVQAYLATMDDRDHGPAKGMSDA